MDLKETYNQIAENWHKDHAGDDWWVKGTDEFISFLKKGDLVLDVGCGAGTKAKYLIGKGLEVIGIDFSIRMVELSKKEVPEAEFFTLDLSQTNKLNYIFDGILMQAVLLHIPKKDVEARLKIILEKLKPGGYLYIAVKEKIPGGIEEGIKIDDDYGYTYERFFSYFSLEDFIGYFKNLGIEMVYKDIIPPSRSARKSQWMQIIGRKK